MSGRGTRGRGANRGAGRGGAGRGMGSGPPRNAASAPSDPFSSLPQEDLFPSLAPLAAALPQAAAQPARKVWGAPAAADPVAAPVQPAPVVAPVQPAPVAKQPVMPSTPTPQTSQETSPETTPGASPEATGSGSEAGDMPRSVKEKSPTCQIANVEFPAKRERGTLGRKIRLRTNHYRINIKKPFVVHQYDLEVSYVETGVGKPRDSSLIFKNKDLMKEIFVKLTSEILPAQYRNKIVYNFSKNLYSLVKLPFEEYVTYDMNLSEGKHRIKLQQINDFTIDIKNPCAVYLQVLDLLFTHSLNYNCVSVNRSFFTSNCDRKSLGFGIELWRGAYASVRPSEIGLTWNMDVSNSAFSTCVDLLELACNHYRCSTNELKQKINNDKYNGEIGASFLKEFKGRKIKTQTGFRKKITGFGPDTSYKFPLTQPGKPVRQVTINEYLALQYKITLKYPGLPCINLGKENFLPMELCRTELSQKKNLDDKQTAEVIKETAMKAPDRMNYVERWIQSSGIVKDPILKEYDIDVSLKMIEFDGRVLSAPDIEYNKAQKIVVKSETIGERGSWLHQNFAFSNPVKIARWVIISMGYAKEDQCYNLADLLVQTGKRHGIMINPTPLQITSTKPRPQDRDVDNKFEEVVKKFHGPGADKLTLIIVILSSNPQAYKQIKTMGDIKYGIATQIIEQKTLDRINPMTASNILLKINTKLNGRNFMLSPLNRMFGTYLQSIYGNNNGNLMIFGADVTHPSNNNPMDVSINSESIAAVTGSLDKECCYYAARLYAQKSPKGQAYEMIHDLDKMVKDLLNEHFIRNGNKYPQRIVFYRDGVSEGQFPLVLRHEINKIRGACQTIHPGYKPAITFVIVQKRHHTRFLAVDSRDQHGKALNVPPGTIVDNTIVSENMFDYFLCSHSGIQGTSKPCRYFVLHDDNNFSTNQMHLMSHYLCHIYSRCPRSVSYPAPAYYSHLAAFRGRAYLRHMPNNLDRSRITSYEIPLHPDMKNKMYYN